MQGKVWKFGNNIDTDLIIAARYLSNSEPSELAKYIMMDADPKFKSKMKIGDIIVAKDNFGCGSSREHAPIALKTAGIQAIIAKTFARIFYRNSFNIGLPIFELKEADEIEEGKIINISKSKEYNFKAIPEFMQKLIKSGGLINFGKEEMLNV